MLENCKIADCNNKNICITCFNHYRFCLLLGCIKSMCEDSCISFFMVTRALVFQTDQLLMDLLERASSLLVTITTFSGHRGTILSARNPKSSVLLSLSCRNRFQLGGSLVLSVTLRRSPLPLLDLVSVFKLEVQ